MEFDPATSTALEAPPGTLKERVRVGECRAVG